MARLINVSDELRADASLLCEELESGNILYFPQTPFSFSEEDLKFLLASKQTGAAYHKNIAYRPAVDRITGLDKTAGRDAERLRGIMRWYSQQAQRFLATLLPPYAGKWKLDFASYRPLEERGRPARLRARNDLPHVDAFPTRPTNGDRILRLFSNINPQQNRVWITAPNFAAIAPQFVSKIGLRAPRTNSLARAIRGLARALHLPGAARCPYDDFMHRCHNVMKEDAAFQESCPKHRWEFLPHSTWIVFTDYVSHAVLEGQYALEQTFIVSQKAMVIPEKSPLAILEGLAGHTLTNRN
jgi:3-deoxy-D-manno-oct-2-ulosonic acid (Kdo) hydroxylase